MWRCVPSDSGQNNPVINTEFLFQLSYLYPAVSPVGHDDVAIGVHSHPSRGVELPVALTVRAELKQELPISTVHLQEMWGRVIVNQDK